MRVFRVSHRSFDRATQHKTLILLIASGVADDDTVVTHPPPFSLSHMQRPIRYELPGFDSASTVTWEREAMNEDRNH